MRIPILGYHKVGDGARLGRRLNIEAERLESHVRYFERRGYGFLTAGKLAGDWPARSVVFTFDDGFEGAVGEGLPRLERHGGRATVYVVTDLIGKESSWPGESKFPLAGWEALRSAAARGHEIGNHSRTHAHFAELSADAQLEEIQSADLALRREGLEPASFCLPYGSYSAATSDVLRKAGIGVCMSVRKGIASDRDDRLMLPRVFVAYGDTLPMLLYRLYVRPLIRVRGR